MKVRTYSGENLASLFSSYLVCSALVILSLSAWTGIVQAQLIDEPCDGGGSNLSIQQLVGREGSDDRLGYDICTELDINRDGKSDLLVSSPGRHQTLVYFWRTTSLSDSADYAYIGGGRMGVGDFNGDGVKDMIVHKPGVERFAKMDSFVVYYGRVEGENGLLFNIVPDKILHLGWSDTSSGFYNHEKIIVQDFNSDGYDDISISFPEWYENTPEGLHGGRICIIEGSDSISNENVHYIQPPPGKAPYHLAQYGSGDINGDLIPDFLYAVQSRFNTNIKIIYGVHNDLTNIFEGRTNDSLSLLSSVSYRYWDVIDVNADGIDDVTFANSLDSLAIYIGTEAGLMKTPYDFWIAPYSSQHQIIAFDGRVESIGDYTGDGYPDFALICTGNHGEVIRVVVLGAAYGMTHLCEGILTDVRDDGLSGEQLGTLADMTGNGIGELVISVPVTNPQMGSENNNRGWAFILRGRKGKELVSVDGPDFHTADQPTLNVSAYPNPTKEVVNISIQSAPLTAHHIILIDVLGRVLSEHDLVTSSLGGGMLSINVKTLNLNQGGANSLYVLVRNDFSSTYVPISSP